MFKFISFGFRDFLVLFFVLTVLNSLILFLTESSFFDIQDLGLQSFLLSVIASLIAALIIYFSFLLKFKLGAKSEVTGLYEVLLGPEISSSTDPDEIIYDKKFSETTLKASLFESLYRISATRTDDPSFKLTGYGIMIKKSYFLGIYMSQKPILGDSAGVVCMKLKLFPNQPIAFEGKYLGHFAGNEKSIFAGYAKWVKRDSNITK